MNCEICRDMLSAQLDGEDPGTDSMSAHAHLDGCPACRSYATGLTDLHRAIRLRTPVVVPDLIDRVMDRVDTPRRFHPEWARYALFTLALVQAGIAVASLAVSAGTGDLIHLTRELAGWDLALAVGFVFASLRPERAAGLLPFALALAAILTITLLFELLSGNIDLLRHAPHLLSLVGAILVAVLASTNWWSVRRATPEPVL